MSGKEIPTTTVLLGGEDIQVKWLNGEEKQVKVRHLSIKQLGSYAESFEDGEKCLELFTGLTPDQIAQLTTESVLTLLEKGHALNADFLGRLVEIKAKVREKLIPNYRTMIEKLVSSALPSTVRDSALISTSASMS